MSSRLACTDTTMVLCSYAHMQWQEAGRCPDSAVKKEILMIASSCDCWGMGKHSRPLVWRALSLEWTLGVRTAAARLLLKALRIVWAASGLASREAASPAAAAKSQGVGSAPSGSCSMASRMLLG